jgi:hypothetical protein
VVLQPAHKVELLVPDLARFELVAAEFPGPSDGRGYTQARLLRERYGFKHELRAAGYVRQDQLFFLARCGFNSFELPENELSAATAAFSTFSAEYQPSNDAGLARKLRHRYCRPQRGALIAGGVQLPPPKLHPHRLTHVEFIHIEALAADLRLQGLAGRDDHRRTAPAARWAQ